MTKDTQPLLDGDKAQEPALNPVNAALLKAGAVWGGFRGKWALTTAQAEAFLHIAAQPAPPASGEVSDEPQCVIAMDEGAREPRLVSWNAFPVGTHHLYLAQGKQAEGAEPVAPKAEPTADYREGVNVDRLRDAMLFLGIAGYGHEETAVRMSECVNQVTQGVMRLKEYLASPPRAIPAEQADDFSTIRPPMTRIAGVSPGVLERAAKRAAEQAAPTEPASIADLIYALEQWKATPSIQAGPSLDRLYEVIRRLAAHPHEAADRSAEALARMLPIFEKLLKDVVFTTDKAGQVAADMNTLRAAIDAAITGSAQSREDGNG